MQLIGAPSIASPQAVTTACAHVICKPMANLLEVFPWRPGPPFANPDRASLWSAVMMFRGRYDSHISTVCLRSRYCLLSIHLTLFRYRTGHSAFLPLVSLPSGYFSSGSLIGYTLHVKISARSDRTGAVEIPGRVAAVLLFYRCTPYSSSSFFQRTAACIKPQSQCCAEEPHH